MTTQEKEIDKQLLQGYKPDTRTAILNNLYYHFKDYHFLEDVNIIGERLQFWMPKDKEDWITDWQENSKVIVSGKLRLFLYNVKDGYIVEIQ